MFLVQIYSSLSMQCYHLFTSFRVLLSPSSKQNICGQPNKPIKTQKDGSGVKRGKSRKKSVTNGFRFTCYWLKKSGVKLVSQSQMTQKQS